VLVCSWLGALGGIGRPRQPDGLTKGQLDHPDGRRTGPFASDWRLATKLVRAHAVTCLSSTRTCGLGGLCSLTRVGIDTASSDRSNKSTSEVKGRCRSPDRACRAL
jgi:hypothetical protein